MSNAAHNARLGNTVRDSGVDRCPCGCKYWEHDVCVDCGGTDVLIDCDHCGREVPFAETSENMCDMCDDAPVDPTWPAMFWCTTCDTMTPVHPFDSDVATCRHCGEAFPCGECGYEMTRAGTCQRPEGHTPHQVTPEDTLTVGWTACAHCGRTVAPGPNGWVHITPDA